MLSTFLPFYLLPPVTKFRCVFGGTSSRPSQSSVVFLEVESCFYLVVSVSFSTGG